MSFRSIILRSLLGISFVAFLRTLVSLPWLMIDAMFVVVGTIGLLPLVILTKVEKLLYLFSGLGISGGLGLAWLVGQYLHCQKGEGLVCIESALHISVVIAYYVLALIVGTAWVWGKPNGKQGAK